LNEVASFSNRLQEPGNLFGAILVVAGHHNQHVEAVRAREVDGRANRRADAPSRGMADDGDAATGRLATGRFACRGVRRPIVDDKDRIDVRPMETVDDGSDPIGLIERHD
jgi:hypothetical protein